MSLEWRPIGGGVEWGCSGEIVVAGVCDNGVAFWIALSGRGFENHRYADPAAAKLALGKRWSAWLRRAALTAKTEDQ